MPSTLRSLVAVLVLSTAGGCRYAPDGAAPLDVPEAYRHWWAQMEECAQRVAPFDRVRFWVVRGDEFPCPKGPCAGHWRSPHDVYIAETWVHNETLVKHEMLHDLLGSGEHPATYFGPAACNVVWSVGVGSAEG